MLYVKSYSEKAIVVTGDTKDFKDDIKELGGKWNKTASGWIFPKSKKDTVVEKLQEVATVEEKDDDEEEEEDGSPARKKQKTEQSSAAAASTSAGSSSTASNEPKFIDLDAKKRVSHNKFKGKDYIDIREYYLDQSGEKKPGTKGIMLTTDVYKKLAEHANDVLEAMGDQDESFFKELGSKKRVSLSKFKGKWYVGIREFWQDDAGEWKPGKKGVGLSVDAYRKLVDNDEEIQKWF